MNVTDLVHLCPLSFWALHHKHCISIELVTGQFLVVRSTMQDFSGFRCTPEVLRSLSPWLQDKPLSTLLALSDLVTQKIMHLATDQLTVAKNVEAVFKGLREHQYRRTRTVFIPALALLLSEYQPHARMAGWTSWLENCSNYCKSRETA